MEQEEEEEEEDASTKMAAEEVDGKMVEGGVLTLEVDAGNSFPSSSLLLLLLKMLSIW